MQLMNRIAMLPVLHLHLQRLLQQQRQAAWMGQRDQLLRQAAGQAGARRG
jgi:hypothetical protein